MILTKNSLKNEIWKGLNRYFPKDAHQKSDEESVRSDLKKVDSFTLETSKNLILIVIFFLIKRSRESNFRKYSRSFLRWRNLTFLSFFILESHPTAWGKRPFSTHTQIRERNLKKHNHAFNTHIKHNFLNFSKRSFEMLKLDFFNLKMTFAPYRNSKLRSTIWSKISNYMLYV